MDDDNLPPGVSEADLEPREDAETRRQREEEIGDMKLDLDRNDLRDYFRRGGAQPK